MENEGYSKSIKASLITAFVFLCMVTGFVTIFQLVLISEPHSTPSPFSELARNCERTDGVLVQGVHQHGDEHSRFSVCVPYEALTCIDVE